MAPIDKLNELYPTWEYTISRSKEWGFMVRIAKRAMPSELRWTDSPVKKAIKEAQKWVIKSGYAPTLEEAVENLMGKL